MKFRNNSTHEFCMHNALGLGGDKVPFLVLFAFCEKTHSIRNFSTAVHSHPFEIFVPFHPFTASLILYEKFKQVTVDDNPAGIRWIKLVI